MKRAELVNYLMQFPPDARILFQGANGWTEDFYTVHCNDQRTGERTIKLVGSEKHEEESE